VTSLEDTLAVIDALESAGIPYMVVGSLSSNYYGIARSTADADFVVELGDRPISRVSDHLGPRLRLEPQMSFETITGTNKYVFQSTGGPFKVEVFLLSDDAHDCERFRRRRRGTVGGREASIPTAEDVIVTKLRWSLRGRRRKDIDDVRNVIAVQQDALHWEYVYGWCDRHGTRQLLDEIRSSVPKC